MTDPAKMSVRLCSLVFPDGMGGIVSTNQTCFFYSDGGITSNVPKWAFGNVMRGSGVLIDGTLHYIHERKVVKIAGGKTLYHIELGLAPLPDLHLIP